MISGTSMRVVGEDRTIKSGSVYETTKKLMFTNNNGFIYDGTIAENKTVSGTAKNPNTHHVSTFRMRYSSGTRK